MRKATVFTIILCLFVLFPLTLNSQPPPPRKKVRVQKPSFILKLPDDTLYHSWSRVEGMVFTPVGELFTVFGKTPLTCVLWDPSNGKILINSTLPLPAASEVKYVDFSSNVQFMAVAVGKPESGWSDRIQLWDTHTGKHISNFTPPTNWMGFSPDGKRFVSIISSDIDLGAPEKHSNIIALWKTGGSGSYIRTLGARRVGAGYGPSLIFSPDGKFLAAVAIKIGSFTQAIDVWDTHTGKKVSTFTPSRNGFNYLRIHDLVASSDGRGLAASVNRYKKNYDDSNYTIESWDWSGKLLYSLKLPPGHGCVNFVLSPDGRMIAATMTKGDEGYQNTVRLWDRDTGEHIRDLLSASGPIYNAVFSPDGQRLVCSTPSDQVPLWNPHTGKIITLLSHGQEHTDMGIFDIVFSPDGEVIAGTIGALEIPIVWKIASDRD